MKARYVCSAIVSLFLLVPFLGAQATDGNLVGSLVDASGAAIVNAQVKITNQATGVESTTKSGNSGEYRFNNIAVGTYDLSITAVGFTPSTQKGVAVELNKTATVNVALQVGTVTETLQVTDAPAAIDTTTAQL